MSITQEEADNIKEHLLKQLDNFPEESRSQIESQIKSMTNEEVEKFIEQNNLTHLGGNCIFCSIVAGKMSSFKIGEDSKNIAILELNPMSKGHTLIVPRDHGENLDNSIKPFIQEIAIKLNDRLKPNEIKMNEIKIMNHAILELIPSYGEPLIKKSASEEELRLVKAEILKRHEAVKTELKKEIKREYVPNLPPRIP